MITTFVPVLRIVLKLVVYIALTTTETLLKLVTSPLVRYLDNSRIYCNSLMLVIP
jgi:hypothetical protein